MSEGKPSSDEAGGSQCVFPALGVDFGTARVGVATALAEGLPAFPTECIDVRRVDPVSRIARLVRERGVRTLVLGLPTRLDGSEGSACARVRTFAESLKSAVGEDVPVVFVDEFASTICAQEKLHEAGRKAKDWRNVVDMAAAAEILETWMNR